MFGGAAHLENFAARGRPRSEEKNPVGGGHPGDRGTLYASRSGIEVVTSVHESVGRRGAEALIAKGYCQDGLPSERTMQDILNRMNYRLEADKKGKPLKKTKETDAIFANVNEVKAQARNGQETVEISMDTKAKVGLGDYTLVGGKTRTDRC